jgi:hypothetical protein
VIEIKDSLYLHLILAVQDTKLTLDSTDVTAQPSPSDLRASVGRRRHLPRSPKLSPYLLYRGGPRTSLRESIFSMAYHLPCATFCRPGPLWDGVADAAGRVIDPAYRAGGKEGLAPADRWNPLCDAASESRRRQPQSRYGRTRED